MDFSSALKGIKSGLKLGRSEWGGRYFIHMRDGDIVEVWVEDPDVAFSVWAPSVPDILAEDWEIV